MCVRVRVCACVSANNNNICTQPGRERERRAREQRGQIKCIEERTKMKRERYRESEFCLSAGRVDKRQDTYGNKVWHAQSPRQPGFCFLFMILI